MATDRVCDQCGRWIDKAEVLYEMTIRLVAEPGPDHVLELPADPDDTIRELEELCQQMEQMDEEQVSEAIDQVFEEHSMTLCPDCRTDVHRLLKQRRSIFGPPHSQEEN